MLKKVRSAIHKYGLISDNDTIVVGVSGGPDSTALLYSLASLKDEFKLKLYVAHLDHMLRRNSSKDVLFVKGLAAKLRLPVTVGRADVKKLLKEGSVEEAARNARLGFLFSVAKKISADKIALGHNLDDQAETVLMRILRGSGLYGLAGIMPKRRIGGYDIIRPLLEIKREEIEAYLKKNRAVALRDPSNKEDIYLRNKIRNRLIPLLEKGYNENIKEVLANMAQSLGADYDYLSGVSLRAMKHARSGFDLARLSKTHPAIQRLLIRRMIAKLQGDTRRITFQHMREIEDLALNRPANSVVDLPKGVSVRKAKKSLIFYRR